MDLLNGPRVPKNIGPAVEHLQCVQIILRDESISIGVIEAKEKLGTYVGGVDARRLPMVHRKGRNEFGKINVSGVVPIRCRVVLGCMRKVLPKCQTTIMSF